MTESNKLILKGTHGTSRTRADSILRIGFTKKGIGRHGTGVYLWAAQDDGDHSEAAKLATCYAQERESAQMYSYDTDSSPRVLICDVLTEHQKFVDVECREINLIFRSYLSTMEEYLNNPKNGSEKSRACQVADGFIAKIEKLRGVGQEVIFAHAAAPASYTGNLSKPARFLGMQNAGCYVVRSINCIQVDSIQWVA